MTKHGYSFNLTILLGVATSGVLLPAGDAFAGCKWYKVCGYTPGDPVPLVQSADPGCFTVNGISVEVDIFGCVSFQLCNESVPIACTGCTGDVVVSLTQPGSPTRSVLFRCRGCGTPYICCGFATVDDCIANICTTPGGDTLPTAINVTACLLPLNQELCAEGIPAFLTASDGAADDFFGNSVSISGDVAVVGARFDDDNGIDSGSAYVFRRIGTSWFEEAKLLASDGAFGDQFGLRVSISGDVVVVGAHRDDDSGTDSGSAYVFRRIGTTWFEQAKLTASDGAVGDFFGFPVSISGDVTVVGAWRDDDNGTWSGSVYVFRRIGTSWTEEAKLTASDGAAGDRFGWSVSISGDVAVVGARDDDDNGVHSGSAYVFQKPPAGWVTMTETAKLTASDGAAADEFGVSASISGDVAVVGAVFDDDNGTKSGSAYVFVKPPGGWVDMTETAKLTASDGADFEGFGLSVSISGDVAVVGAPWAAGNVGDSGLAYVFQKPPAGWVTMTETAKLTALGGVAPDNFGRSTSIDGATAVVGATFDSHRAETKAGSAYIFTGVGGPDCNANEVPDGCDILNGVSEDCNANGVPDLCDIAVGFSPDCNANEIPDECEVVFAFVAESLQLSPIGDGFPQSLTIADALPPASDVTLSFVARGDFGNEGEFVDVDINGVAVGSVFVNFAGDCTVPYDIDQIVVPAATYNSALKGGPDALINMVASAVVDPNPILCGSFIALTVQYQAIPPTDANGNGIPDECEGPQCGDCPTDVDGNGETEAFDLANLLGKWGPVTPASACLDADGNGFIEAFDLAVLLGAWGPC